MRPFQWNDGLGQVHGASILVKLAALCISGFGLVGCLTQTPETEGEDEVDLTGFSSSVSGTPSGPARISGTVSSNGGIDSVVATLSDSKGSLVQKVKLPGTSKTSLAVQDLQFSSLGTDDCNGSYSVNLVAYSGDASASMSISLDWSGAKNCNSSTDGNLLTISASLPVGAQENATLGSSIDLDGPTVYLSSAARTNSAQVDLVYAYSFATDTDKLGSPSWAKDNVDFMTGWSTYNPTQLHKVTGKAFADIKTTQDLDALWSASSATTLGVDVKAGDLVIAKTNMGKIVLIQIVSQVPGETGQINIKVAK